MSDFEGELHFAQKFLEMTIILIMRLMMICKRKKILLAQAQASYKS